MRLHTDEARVGVNARRLPACVAGAGPKACRFLAIEPYSVLLIVDLDFVVMPSPSCQILSVLVVLLPSASAKQLDLVDRASPSEERAIGLIETGIAACFFVDLNFESRMYRHKGSVI